MKRGWLFTSLFLFNLPTFPSTLPGRFIAQALIWLMLLANLTESINITRNFLPIPVR
jgi:hypothetical protein